MSIEEPISRLAGERPKVEKKGGLNKEEREKIVLENQQLVRGVAAGVWRKLPPRIVELKDLINEGNLGLLDAIRKYDPEKGVLFRTYAEQKIRGAVLDSLRQLDWVSKDIRRFKKRLDRVTVYLRDKLKRDPTEEELAKEMRISVEKLRSDSSIFNNTQREKNILRMLYNAKGFADSPDSIYAEKELKSKLLEAIGTLPKRYQRIIMLYYTDDMTMKEIGKLMGVNESRISQIVAESLWKLNYALRGKGITSSKDFLEASLKDVPAGSSNPYGSRKRTDQ